MIALLVIVDDVDNVLSQATITAHNYTEWIETKKPTLTEEGLKTLCCSCGKESSETEVIAAGADFTRDFSNETANGTWKYGAVNYHWDTNTFDFNVLTETNGYAWLGDGVEVKNDWVNAAGMLGIGYTTTETVNINSLFKFVGGTEETQLSLRIFIINSTGTVVLGPDYHNSGNKTIEVNKDFSLNAGDTIYFILGNEKWDNPDAYPNGALSISLKQVKVVADYTEDFSNETSDGTWKYGKVEYHWGETETFDFNPLTENNGYAWLGDGVEVKNDWVNFGAMLGIGYTATEAMNINVKLNFVGGTEDTRLSVRVAVKNSEGNIVLGPEFNGSDSKFFELNKDFSLNAGDTVYFIINNENSGTEGAWPNGNLRITVYNK